MVLSASALFDNGLLTVTGDAADNFITIFAQADNGTPYVMVQDDGVTSPTPATTATTTCCGR
jgi:hypothetical protein